MAEINKLSVEKALNKLRSTEQPKSKTVAIEKQLEATSEELERLRAATRRLRPPKPSRSPR